MKLVAGLRITNLSRRQVWDEKSPYYVSALKSVMFSFGEVRKMRKMYRKVLEIGLHKGLDIPLELFLDNGAFTFTKTGIDPPYEEYVNFVRATKPDWYAIPRDYIPTPNMSKIEQKEAFEKTMKVNNDYANDDYVPILHMSSYLERYIDQLQHTNKTRIGLGGLVPHLLGRKKAMHYIELFDKIRLVREVFANKELHLFGIGGIGTLHIAALLGADSVDTSVWSICAAYGKIHVSGRTDCNIIHLSNWDVRKPDKIDLKKLEECTCLPCKREGVEGLSAPGKRGECNRASHNLHTLLSEKKLIEDHIAAGTYNDWYRDHLQNPQLLPLIARLTGTSTQLELF